MALFQNSVRKKHIAAQDHPAMQEAFERYRKYFHNPLIHSNIRAAKEEQFQEGFLRELFVNILGYTINPNPDYNLTTELKNIKDAKKTDGAILKEGNAIAVIELKGTDTKDLEKVRDQAFNYKNNQPECHYVITSNFEKLRFYIDNAIDFVEFNVFSMHWEDFTLLWLLLQKDNLLNHLPKKVKEESLLVEEQITKQLYADYTSFKQELWQDTVARNPEQDELELYKKSQKLLDRFLFIFFAEDKGLLPPNSIMEIVRQWNHLKELDAYAPLYERFLKYFGYLNTGRVQPGKAEIHAYNGGLFAPDPILDTLKISDEVLEKHVKKITEYDFDTEVDTNILGHIFEHSLNDIENVRASLEGTAIDKSKTKRKKDGVFYTPKYITKYIVDNTLGRLCEEKKKAYEIVDEDFAEGKRGRQKKTIQKLKEKLDQYRVWLLQLTICDPACGSGAFLNQVLEFLIAEHRYLDELESQLFGTPMVLPNVENQILENNIFGVDINEESVEIARLSLWLRTAKKGRKLSSLNSNIKVGNSLIDDPEVAGDLAFNWEKEFPKVFDKGGFDVVVGNPPYVKRQNISNQDEINLLEKEYVSATYNFDLYILFIEKGSLLINDTGLVSYINPSKFTSTKTGEGIRLYIDANCHILQYVDFKNFQVFDDAITYCCIFILDNSKKGETEYLELNEISPKEISSFNSESIVIKDSESGLGWSFQKTVSLRSSLRLKDYVKTITGIESGADSIYILQKDDYHLNEFVDSIGKVVFPTIKGANLFRYYFEKNPYYAVVPYSEDGDLLNISELQSHHKGVWNYLLKNESELRARENGKMNHENWFGYVYPKNLHKYTNPRIVWTDISIYPQFSIDETESWHVRTVCSLELNEKGIQYKLRISALLPLLNSKLLFYFIKTNSNSVRGGYLRYKPQYVKEFPIPENWSDNSQIELEKFGEIQLNNVRNLRLIIDKQVELLQSKFSITKPSTKLKNWPTLDFKGFLAELKKAKVKLSLPEEAEWMAYFNEQKAKAQELQTEINRLDHEIDQLVYQLYGLTEEEIKIVEGGDG